MRSAARTARTASLVSCTVCHLGLGNSQLLSDDFGHIIQMSHEDLSLEGGVYGGPEIILVFVVILGDPGGQLGMDRPATDKDLFVFHDDILHGQGRFRSLGADKKIDLRGRPLHGDDRIGDTGLFIGIDLDQPDRHLSPFYMDAARLVDFLHGHGCPTPVILSGHSLHRPGNPDPDFFRNLGNRRPGNRQNHTSDID